MSPAQQLLYILFMQPLTCNAAIVIRKHDCGSVFDVWAKELFARDVKVITTNDVSMDIHNCPPHRQSRTHRMSMENADIGCILSLFLSMNFGCILLFSRLEMLKIGLQFFCWPLNWPSALTNWARWSAPVAGDSVTHRGDLEKSA